MAGTCFFSLAPWQERFPIPMVASALAG
jgi:hypothetical protein